MKLLFAFQLALLVQALLFADFSDIRLEKQVFARFPKSSFLVGQVRTEP